MRFLPHVTVASIIEDQGRFLLVKELIKGREVFNQPAGHLEANETLVDACIRETLEETGWQIEPYAVTGIYLYQAPANGVTYQRVCFAAKAIQPVANAVLDEGIIGPEWLTREELIAKQEMWRSPMVLKCIDDYLNKAHYSLDILR